MIRSSYHRPIENLHAYIDDRIAHQEAGFINGQYLYRGKFYSEKEFNAKFPQQLIYKVIQLDGKQVKTN